jgi:putative transcriptional regulator
MHAVKRTALFAFLALVAALLAPAAPEGAQPDPAAPPGSDSLAGQLLIASTEIGDPRFQHSVILMVRHDKEGAFGIMVNRPAGERSLASLLAAIGEKDAPVEGSLRIFAGGPVEPQIGFVVHSSDYHRSETIDIDGHLAVTSSIEIVRDIAHDKGPKKALLAFGYAGWGPGQLESELARHGWFTAPADPALVFDDNRERLWDDAMSRRARDL